MLRLRTINDSDIPLIEIWLNKEHVKRWLLGFWIKSIQIRRHYA